MAAGDLWLMKGAGRVWTGSGTDEALDATSLASGGVVVGSYHDYGALPRPDEYQVDIVIDGMTGTPTAGQTIDIYLATSETTTDFDGLGSGSDPTDTVEGSATTDGLKNMVYAGSVAVESSNPAHILRASNVVRAPKQVVAVVMHNNTDNALAAVNTHRVTVTPIYSQGQTS